jgi:acyl-CoA hydrolase
VCTALPAAQSATKVIAQINPNIPRVHGHSFLHYSSFDYVVDVTGSPDAVIPAVDPSPISDKEMRIGKILADLIPDGATLQVGIGAIPNAVLKSLTNHRDLGIHSEMISDGAMELIKSGAVNNMRKDFIPGRTVSSFLVGSKALYDFVDDNPGTVAA